MKNMAYTKNYLTYRQQQSVVFCEDYLRSEKLLTLSPQYQILKRSYLGEVGQYTLHTTENDLLDKTGKVIYTYRNLNDDCEFVKIIAHHDGNKYLLFRTDLYGYSVLSLTTLRDFHYIPSGSFPQGETFIWTDVFYNAANNLIAVSGCYWACPFGTMLQDFSSPMAEPAIVVDIQERIEDGYERYDDVNFMKWHGTDLVLNAINSQTQAKETISLSEQEYRSWLKGI